MIQHEALGVRLRAVRDEIFSILVIVDDHYNAKLGMQEPAEKALTSVNRLMESLADQIIDDHPREKAGVLRAVYRKS